MRGRGAADIGRLCGCALATYPPPPCSRSPEHAPTAPTQYNKRAFVVVVVGVGETEYGGGLTSRPASSGPP